MATSQTPLWLDLKTDYIDENFNKVFSYIYKNNIGTKDAFYDITIDLLEKRIEALIQEFHAQPLLQDETLTQNKDRIEFIARLLGLYLLAVKPSSKNYRSAFLLFAYTLAVLEPQLISLNFICNALKYTLLIHTGKSILEWKEIETFNSEIVTYKFNAAIATTSGIPQSGHFDRLGTLQLSMKKLQLSAVNKSTLTESLSTSLSIMDDIIQVMSPKSEKLKQSLSTDINSIREFTAQFIADQQKACRKLKNYAPGNYLDVRVVGKKNNHLQVVSTDPAYHQIRGEVKFAQNFFFYNEMNFINVLNVDDEFEAEYLGDDVFDIKNTFSKWIKDDERCIINSIVKAKAVMITNKLIGWGTEDGYGVHTSLVEGVEIGDCADIRIQQMDVKDGIPTGWIYGIRERAIDEDIDFDAAKAEAISLYIYEKEETANTSSALALSAEFVKIIYRFLVFGQQLCVANPTDRYKIISVCQMLATLIDQREDVEYTAFLAEYLENLVRFAKSEYDAIEIPEFPEEKKVCSIVRRERIIAILQAYGSTSNAEILDDIIDNEDDELLVKLATLVQSCNRLEEVINRSMQNVIKREIIANLAVETEGETDLEEDNGIYLGIENNRQEFKTSFFHAPANAKEQRQEINIFKGVCAFLNTSDGGTLYLGVNDLGYVQGINDDITTMERTAYGNYKGIDGYMRYITDHAKKYFDIDAVANIKMRPMYDNKVIALEITPYEFGVVTLNGIAYLRVNAESVAINEAAIQRITSKKKLTTIKKDTVIENLSTAIREQRCATLHQYQSSNSGNIRDRKVEVFDFTDNGTSVWCYDLEKCAVRLFNIARIGRVTVLNQEWANQDKHERGNIDIFNMTGSTSYDICLRLNLRAKNLLLEEYPRSKDYITKEKGESWLLNTSVYNLAGVARFYMGLANSIDIINAPELKKYVTEYCQAYLIKK